MKTEFSKEERKLLKSFGTTFKQLRLEAGFETQEDFADSIGMPRSQYQEYESGVNMKAISVMRLASHHNLSLKDFILIADGNMLKKNLTLN